MPTATVSKKEQDKKVFSDTLLDPRQDRRLLANVPDESGERSNNDRRGSNNNGCASFEEYVLKSKAGVRYQAAIRVRAKCRLSYGRKESFSAQGVDISSTGMLLRLSGEEQLDALCKAEVIKLKFRIKAGSMPEGYEMRVEIAAKVVRAFTDDEGVYFCGIEFEEDLSRYAVEHKDKHALAISSLFMFFIIGFIILMRAESVLYFKFNRVLYFYSIVTAAFLLSRYLFGSFYRPVTVNMNFSPGVTIIIPCFNEEEWIQKTIVSCVNQDYPIDKLEVIVVDDCSNDQSVEKIKEIIGKLHSEGARFKTRERVRYIVQPQNLGKRHALAQGVMTAKHELVVFVDSDSFLDPYAIRNLVMPFQDPKMGGVSGRTDVANTFTNALTKMQAVRYYIAFRIMKAAESVFDIVTCLSGPLSCYRKELVIEYLDDWLNQKFLGRKATFGDDRSLTNFIMRKHRTAYQDTAICATIVPNRYKVFLAQQMRWKRSWLRESIIAGSFMWRKEPLGAILFYIGLLVPVAAPVVVVYNMLYVPIAHRIFPTTFLIGMLMMALLMSIVQLYLKKSSTWVFGMLFCVFYESVLLWQMPVAWFTFWKSNWGTRQTPADIAKTRRKRKGKQAAVMAGVGEHSAPEGKNGKKSHTFFAKRERRKRFSVVVQGGALLLAIYFVLMMLTTTSRYQPYEAVVAGVPDNGFIAVSYFGIDRNGTNKMLSTNQLEQQLKALKESGYVTITQQDVRDYYAGKKALPEKSLLLMFEDGRRDTAIFAQKIMEKHNNIGTVFSYADNFDENDPKFLNAGDLKKLVESSYWELGTNGYRLSFINVFDRYDNYLGELSPLEFSMVSPYINRKYDHYLMDYIRDEYGIPKEGVQDLKDRINLDYELMKEVYERELGAMPDFYALMHANTGQFATSDMASRINEDNIYRLFPMNVNREGLALNDKNNLIYDITRLQPQPYWSTNHLLMRLWDDTQQEMAFVTGDSDRAALWRVLDGKTEFTKNNIIVTSLPSGLGRVQLDGARSYKNVEVSVQLLGNALGSQAVLLRADQTLENYISVAVRDKKLVISQVRNGEQEELFSERLDIINGDPRVSVSEDKKETEIGGLEMRLKYAPSVEQAASIAERLQKVQQHTTESVKEGAEEFLPNIDLNELQNKTMTILLERNNLSVVIDGVEAVSHLQVKSSPAGLVALESRSSTQNYSQRNLTDDVYDGVFRDVVITEHDRNGDMVFDGRLKAVEKAIDTTKTLWHRLINWFIETL
ncbi:glycosyltransferase [Oscillospiraceae bacterium LTW-04]|nr:glycosyltransferase [Oscillospiraceae bacterium MB24-C1]